MDTIEIFGGMAILLVLVFIAARWGSRIQKKTYENLVNHPDYETLPNTVKSLVAGTRKVQTYWTLGNVISTIVLVVVMIAIVIFAKLGIWH